MAHMDVPEKESQDGGPTHLDPPSQGHSSVPVRPGRPSRGLPSGTSVSGTSVMAFKSNPRKTLYSSLNVQFNQILTDH